MTDAEVIAAIKANHLKANTVLWGSARLDWQRATVDRGGSIWGPGPYLKVPVYDEDEPDDDIRVRIYPPERLRKKLAAQWEGMPK